jgi:hypothetical protein
VNNFIEMIIRLFSFRASTDLAYGDYNASLRELMDRLGVDNIEDLRAKISEDRLNRGESTSNDIGYYGFNSAKLGWVNCDEFTTRGDLITMKTDVKVQNDIYTSLVFKEEKCIFPSASYGRYNSFPNVPDEAPVYHVVIKLKGDNVLLSIVDTQVDKKAPEPVYEEIKLTELKGKLALLDQ